MFIWNSRLRNTTLWSEFWKNEVMEHYIPRFFTNVAATYKLYMQDKPKNKNNIKPKVSKKI